MSNPVKCANCGCEIDYEPMDVRVSEGRNQGKKVKLCDTCVIAHFG